MTTDTLAGNWKTLVGDIKKKWGQFTDNDLQEIGGNKDKFLGGLQKKYGYSMGEAKEELEKFLKDKSDKFESLKDQAMRSVQELPQQLKELPHQLKECVNDNPLTSVLVAACAGLFLGMVLRR